METVDLSKFMEDTRSAETLSYDYALEISHLVVSEMQKQGLTKKELAERMGVSPQRLANLLNTQPNMTLKTVAQFGLALGICVEFSSGPRFTSELPFEARDATEGNWAAGTSCKWNSGLPQSNLSRHLTVLKGGLAA